MNKKKIQIPDDVNECVLVVSNLATVKSIKAESITIVYVQNVKKAYYKFITYYRSLFTLPIIGVTGTCGKTTTKEMIAWILSKDLNVVKTRLSENGLSRNLKYLMQIDDKTDVAVIEMGVDSPHNMLYTASYFKPEIGVITNIGVDHLEGFNEHDKYIEEKAKMLTALQNKGVLVLNADDEYTKKINLNDFKGKIVYVSLQKDTMFTARNIRYGTRGMRFNLSYDGKVYPCFVPGFGEHNVYNALYAFAVCMELKISIIDAIERLKSFKQVRRHTQFKKGINESVIIDDTWSTNPTSIKAALDVLKHASKANKKIVVLGDIEELGQSYVNEYMKVAELVVNSNVDFFVTIGEKSKVMSDRAIELGMDTNKVFHSNDQQDAFDILQASSDRDTCILVKTSMNLSYSGLIKRLTQF
jgi:UDP-N-acetylmuramoyl-tripeptide--D-alanyl-D-alanine ligase